MNWLIKFLMFHLVKKLNFYYLIGTDEAGQGSLFSISDSSYFGGHFSLPGHSVNDMVPLAIEKVRCSDPKLEPALRKRREKLWINRYDATTYGCNKRE